MAYTLTSSTKGTLTLPNVNEDSRRKRANLMVLPMPASDSSETLEFDFMGCEKHVILRGIKTGSASECKTFATQLDSLLDGKQVTFVLSADSETVFTNINVLIEEISFNLQEGIPYTKLLYEIQLVEGTA